MLSFKPVFFSFFSFTLIKKLFISSSLSAIKVVSSAYLWLLIFLLVILIPSWYSPGLTFHMFSTYRLNKQGDNIQSWHTLFPILNQSIVPSSSNWCFLTCIQVSQEANKVVWDSHLFKHSQFVVIHTVKGFSIVNEAEVDVFLELSEIPEQV